MRNENIRLHRGYQKYFNMTYKIFEDDHYYIFMMEGNCVTSGSKNNRMDINRPLRNIVVQTTVAAGIKLGTFVNMMNQRRRIKMKL